MTHPYSFDREERQKAVQERARALTKEEVLSLIDLLERVRLPAEREFKLIEPDPLWNMVVYLMKRHLTGMLVTPTSLARAADVPYTTALRRVEDMRQSGLLIYRPRTRSKRSFSIHPSQKLIDRIFEYAQGVKGAIAKTLGQQDSTSFYLGASYLSARIIPGPAVLKEGLGIGKTLDILLYNDDAFSVGKKLHQEISHLLGGNIRVHRVKFDEIRTRTLENAEKAVSEFDIVAVDMPWIGEFAARGVLMPLDDLVAGSSINRADFHAAEWEGTYANSHQYGVPLLTNPEVLYYRRDMFDAGGVEPPATTDQLLSAARRLHSPRQKVYGISWTAARGTPVGQAFIQFLADFGQPVLNLRRVADGYDATHVSGKEYMPLIDTPRGRATAEFMLQLMEFSPPDILDVSWEEQVALINEGRVAMAYEWATRASRLKPDSPTAGQIGFLPHPVGITKPDERRDNVSPIGGFALGIPANIGTDRAALAWRAIEWFTSPEVIKLFVQHGSYVMPRFSVAADPEVRRLSSVIPAVDAMAKKGQLRLWPRPPVPEYPAMVAILGEEMHDMLAGKQSAKQALGRAQARVDAMMRDHRHY
jgi:multiple sugar transport system substrate-binding protein